MKKKIKIISTCFFASLLIIITLLTPVQAHSGRIHRSGGHHNNQNVSGLDSYHYCEGYPAHLHNDGVCPYRSASTANDYASSTAQTNATPLSTPGIHLSSGETLKISSDLIKIVQDVLNQQGYDCGPADGIAGTTTKTAIENYLNDNQSKDDTDYLIISMVAEAL